jgi:hypothetical protein
MSRVTDAPRNPASGTSTATGDPSGSGTAQGLPKQRHVCPFCGTLNESAVTPCVKCTLMNTPQTRRVTRGRIGPWYVLQSRNPAAPGMKFDVLVGFIRKGQVTARSIVRGPTTHQFWRYAAHVRGVSREFGLCYACGSDIHTESHLCLHCGKIQEPPAEPDVLLEVSLPDGNGRARPVGAGVPEIVDAEVVRSEDSMMGVSAFPSETARATRVEIEPQVEPVPEIIVERAAVATGLTPAERAAAAAKAAAYAEARAQRVADAAQPSVDPVDSAPPPRVTITIDSARPETVEPVVAPGTFARTPLTEAHLADRAGVEAEVAASTVSVSRAMEPEAPLTVSTAVDQAPHDTETTSTTDGTSPADRAPIAAPGAPSNAEARKQPAPAVDFTSVFSDPDLAATLDAAAGTPFAEEQVANFAPAPGGPQAATATTASGETGLMAPADIEAWFHSHFTPVAEFNHEPKREPRVSVSSPRFWSTTFLVLLTLTVAIATISTYFPAEREKAVGWMSVHLLVAREWVVKQYAAYLG